MSKAGRKSKYETCIEPYLDKIKAQVKKGVTEEAIAESLGICVATLNNYKKTHKEFAEALSKDKGAEILDSLVNAGIEGAKDRFVEEERMIVELDEDGNVLRKRKEIYKKFVQGNPALHLFYVQHYGKDKGYVKDPAELKLKQDKLELERQVQSLRDWNEYDLDPNNK